MIHSDAKCFHFVSFVLIKEQLIFNIWISSMSYLCLRWQLRKERDIHDVVLFFQFFNVKHIFELCTMNIVRGLLIFLPINRLSKNSNLIKFSIGSNYHILLPIELLISNAIIIKWEVIDIPINNWLTYHRLDVSMDHVHFIFLGFELKKLFHTNQNKIHGPSKYFLMPFDFLIHKVSCEKEAKLRIEVFLSNLFNKTSDLVNFDRLSWWIVACDWRLDTAIFKHDRPCIKFEKDMFFSFSRSVSIFKALLLSFSFKAVKAILTRLLLGSSLVLHE